MGKTHWWSMARGLLAGLTAVVLVLGLVACGDRPAGKTVRPSGANAPLVGNVSEVSPPEVLQDLRPFLETYQPQIKILSPRPNEVLTDEQVSVRFQVKDLPIHKDKDLGLGPNLHVILDNQPYQAVYDLEQDLVFKDLAPGTHTIRAIASRPWHETFKNDGAFALTTFHVLTKTPENQPAPGQPLLTYSRPTGTYGAEPVMLDFYLTNVPLHLIAQGRADDSLQDWRIRATVNGESFIFDEWQPIYLKGLKPGKNWVQLELLNEDGDAIANAFNNTVRLINYQPGGTDTLSKLVRGELTAAEARGIVDPNYVPAPPVPTPPPSPTPSPGLVPAVPTPESSLQDLPPSPAPSVTPSPIAPTEPSDLAPTPTPIPSPTPTPPQARPSAKRTRRVERSPVFSEDRATEDKAADDKILPSPSSPEPTVEPELENQVERSPAIAPAPLANPEPRLLPQVERSPKPEVTTPVEPAPAEVLPPVLEAPEEELAPVLTEPAELETVSPATSPAPSTSKATSRRPTPSGASYLARLRQLFSGSKAAPKVSPTPGPSSQEEPTDAPAVDDLSSKDTPSPPPTFSETVNPDQPPLDELDEPEQPPLDELDELIESDRAPSTPRPGRSSAEEPLSVQSPELAPEPNPGIAPDTIGESAGRFFGRLWQQVQEKTRSLSRAGSTSSQRLPLAPQIEVPEPTRSPLSPLSSDTPVELNQNTSIELNQ